MPSDTNSDPSSAISQKLLEQNEDIIAAIGNFTLPYTLSVRPSAVIASDGLPLQQWKTCSWDVWMSACSTTWSCKAI